MPSREGDVEYGGSWRNNDTGSTVFAVETNTGLVDRIPIREESTNRRNIMGGGGTGFVHGTEQL